MYIFLIILQFVQQKLGNQCSNKAFVHITCTCVLFFYFLKIEKWWPYFVRYFWFSEFYTLNDIYLNNCCLNLSPVYDNKNQSKIKNLGDTSHIYIRWNAARHDGLYLAVLTIYTMHLYQLQSSAIKHRHVSETRWNYLHYTISQCCI